MVWQEDLRAIWSDLGGAVHLYGGGCVVEGYRGVVLFTPALIRIRCRTGCVAVAGEGLSILSLGPDEVHVQGRVDSVCYERV